MKPRKLMKVSTILSMILLSSSLTLGGVAYAKGKAPAPGVPPVPAGGGTAKPPAKNLVAPVFVPTLSNPLLPGSNAGLGQTVFAVNPAAINGLGVHGFDAVGIIQNAKVDTPADAGPGITPGCSGSVTVDSKNIVIPCGLIIQMPANTVTWASFVAGGVPPLEIHLVGNSVGGRYIAALGYISQQSLHAGSGTITSLDYGKGEIIVDGVTTLQINDPFGRFGRAQSPDPRFSVDDQNPTIHSGTGYPMCVPRSGPDKKVTDIITGNVTYVKYPDNGLTAYSLVNGVPQDPLCPQNNRPLAAGGCRNFGQSGFAPPVSGELTVPVAGQTYCSQYVMPAIDGAAEYPLGTKLVQTNAPPFNFKVIIPGSNDPDPRQQAPFEVGDFLAYSGTLLSNGTVSTHTIEASVGIFTQPGTQPAYIAIGGFGIGTADPGTAVTGVGQETTNRMFLETGTSDFRTPIDIYLMDEATGGVLPGGIINRWVTPWEMTGECPPANGLPAANGGNAPLAASCNGVTGGISTSLTGPQAQRDRIRAIKSPLGLLSQPSRTIRVVQRSLCTPTAAVPNGPGLVDACLTTASLDANRVANGLVAGQYFAPVFEFIFPENAKQGDIIVPNDLWHLPFIRNGESSGTGAPALNPLPW